MSAERPLGLACTLAVLLVLIAALPGRAAESPPTLLWNATSFADNFWGRGVGVGPDGHPVAASTRYVFNGPDARSFIGVVKHDGTTGAELWNITYDAGVYDQAFGIAIGPDGHPVVGAGPRVIRAMRSS